MWYDIFIVCILLFFTIRGAAKGMIWQIAHIAGIILCFVFADIISAKAGPYVHLDPPLNEWVVMVAAYLCLTFVCFGIARSMNSWVEKNKMKEFDRHLGAMFGLLKGVILALILTFAVVTVSDDARSALIDSHSGRMSALIMDRLHPIIPERLHAKLEDYIHRLDHPGLDLKYSNHDHDHDDDLHDDPPRLQSQTPAPSFNDPFLGNSGTLPSPTNPSNPAPSGGFWNSVRAMLTDEAQRTVNETLQRIANDPAKQQDLQQKLMGVLNSTEPKDRAAIAQQISQLGASELEQYLNHRIQQISAPAVPKPPATTPTTPNNPVSNPPANQASGRQQIIRDIAGAYSTIPNIRQNIEQDISQRLAGLQERIVTGVIEDWRSDLLQTGNDPDPGTNANSTIEERILRQAQRAGIPLNQLPVAIQQQLRNVQNQSGSSSGNPL